MTWTELLLGTLWNLTGVSIFLAVITGIAAIVLGVIAYLIPADTYGMKDADKAIFTKYWIGNAKKFAAAFLVFAFIGCIPSVDDLWKIRIGMIKLELSSPENLAQAKTAIERIGAKLECKYIGGENCKDGKLIEKEE